MDFSVKVVKQELVNAVNGGQMNIVSSPLSIAAILSVLAAGSKGGTAEKLLAFFGCDTVYDIETSYTNLATIATNAEEVEAPGGDKGPIINFVNGLWSDQRYTIKPSFQQSLLSVFGAETKSLDFANKASEAAEEINSWVSRATNGFIKKIINDIDNETIFILANALYFKGTWECTFDVSKTKDNNFYLLNGENVQVPFMSSKQSDYHFFGSFETFKVVKLYYKSSRHDSRQFSMHLFLPHERDGLQNMIQEFFDNPKLFLNQKLDIPKTRLDEFLIPKFKLSYTFDAYKIMQDLGLELNIDDVSNMIEYGHDKGGGVEIIQTSQIEVNEEGTEAAAVTFSRVRKCRRLPKPDSSFVADHPFMFVIKEDTSSTPFFVGALLNPLS